MIQDGLMFRLYEAMRYEPPAANPSPVKMMALGSTRMMIRETMNMPTADATPRGAMTRPVVSAG